MSDTFDHYGDAYYDDLEEQEWRNSRFASFGPIVQKPKKIGDKCTQCNGTLISRINKKTNVHFLGCSEYPRCKKSFALEQ